MTRQRLWQLPDEWWQTRAEVAARRRQERYRRSVTPRLDPEFEQAIRQDDHAVIRHNMDRALALSRRDSARWAASFYLRSLHIKRSIVNCIPRPLRPLAAFTLATWADKFFLRGAIADATKPLPQGRRSFAQARNFTPKH